MWTPLTILRGRKKKEPRPLRYTEIKDRERKRGKILRLFLLFVAFCFFIFMVRALWSRFFIKDTECHVETGLCDENLLKVSRELIGKSMFSNLHFTHPFLVVSLKRQWPNRIIVTFGKPTLLVTLLSSQEGKPAYSLTASGVLVSFTLANQHLPPLYDFLLEKMPIGSTVDEKKHVFYAYLSSKAPSDVLSHIQKITVSDEETVTMELDAATRVVADTSHIDSEFLSLQALLSSPTIDRSGKTIDLRFDNPVLK